ncbi:hypothetical protein BBJ28_00025591 [Nothophytophthora sp. Chile5]|nr:hypothetical protein BBJ28_00025591 [Nothophytophthora sp. Chile5]
MVVATSASLARRTVVLLALALSVLSTSAAASPAVCSLPATALYVNSSSSRDTLLACATKSADDSSREQATLAAACKTACSCRRFESGSERYGLCLNTSADFDCDTTADATDCSTSTLDEGMGQNASPSCSLAGIDMWSQLTLHSVLTAANVATSTSQSNSTPASAAGVIGAGGTASVVLAADGGSGGLKVWEWVLIGLAIAIALGLLIFVINWFKHRPLRGDNRSEVAQAVELSRSQPKEGMDMVPVGVRESQARTIATNRESAARSTNRSHDTNPSQISGFSGSSYHTYAGGPMSSTLTDTEVEVQHQERVFSPISDSSHSVNSSSYSQGVDTTTTPNTALLAPEREEDGADTDSEAYPSFSSFSLSSDMGSFSSQITVDDGSDMDTGGSAAPYPRKKSIEF